MPRSTRYGRAWHHHSPRLLHRAHPRHSRPHALANGSSIGFADGDYDSTSDHSATHNNKHTDIYALSVNLKEGHSDGSADTHPHPHTDGRADTDTLLRDTESLANERAVHSSANHN